MKLFHFFFLILIVFEPHQTFANVGDGFGLGSRNSALGSAGGASSDPALFTYYNPGLLSLSTIDSQPHSKRLELTFGYAIIQPKFSAIDNVVTANSYTSDNGAAQYGNVDINNRLIVGQLLAVKWVMLPESQSLTLGVVSFLPVTQLARVDTGETYLPEYFQYRARTERPELLLALSGNLTEQWALGVGAQFGFTSTSRATMYLKTTTGEPSTMRFVSSIKPKLRPYFGIGHSNKDSFTQFGLVVRLAQSYDNTVSIDADAEAIAGLAGFPVEFGATSSLFYDPHSLELSFAQRFESLSFLFEIDFQKWSLYQRPSLSIENATAGSGLVLSPTQNPSFDFRDIFVPKFGFEFAPGDRNTLYRLGYSYRPSSLGALPTESGNYLDPPKHSLGVGMGFQTASWRLDFHLGIQFLVTQNIQKSAGNEAGDAGDLKIGAPGYEAGGNIYSGGVSINLGI